MHFSSKTMPHPPHTHHNTHPLHISIFRTIIEQDPLGMKRTAGRQSGMNERTVPVLYEVGKKYFIISGEKNCRSQWFLACYHLKMRKIAICMNCKLNSYFLWLKNRLLRKAERKEQAKRTYESSNIEWELLVTYLYLFVGKLLLNVEYKYK